MKKNITIILILIVIVGASITNIIGQSIFYDSNNLVKLLDTESKKWPDVDSVRQKVSDILAHYCKKNDIRQVFFEDNPFINVYAQNISSLSALGTGGLNLPLIPPFLSGLDVTNVADGLAKFMVERFKEDLNESFFKKFKKELEEIKYFKTLFPETFNTLQIIDTKIYGYSSYLESLRAAFKIDITNLYTNINILFNEKEFLDFFNKNPEIGTMVRTGFYIMKQISKKEHPGKILEEFDTSLILGSDTSHSKIALIGAIQTLKAISHSLRDEDTNLGYWVPLDSIRALVEDRDAFRIYLGLIYQKYSNINFSKGTTLRNIMKPLATAFDTSNHLIEDYKNFILDIGASASKVEANLNELLNQEVTNSPIDYTKYYGVISASYGLFDHTLSFFDLPYIDSAITQTDVAQIKKVAKLILFAGRTIGDIYVDTRIKNYSSAVFHTAAFFDSLNIYKKILKDVNFVPSFLKYGTFMANMVYAKNSDEVKNIIESVALPPTSAIAKRESGGSGISLNGYLGIFAGEEIIPGEKTENKKFTAGFSAPVGLELHFFVPFGSLSIFTPIIDIGALASFRFKDTSAAILPVKLGSIIAPGIGLVWGIPGIPISIGGLYQIGPLLREINSNAQTVTDRMNHRWLLFVSADIPILNFCNF